MWRWGAFGAAVLVSLVALVVPGGGVPGGPAWADEVVHVAIFAALAVTGAHVLPVGPLALGLVVYAVATELAQALLALQRAGSPADVAADVVGITAGLAAARLLVPRLTRLRSRLRSAGGPAPRRGRRTSR